MSEHTETLCDLWDEEQIETNFHSHLYHLEPIEVGSPMVESLTSYVVRLAQAHSIHPYALFYNEILPLLDRSHLYQNSRLAFRRLTSFWRRSTSFNSTSAWARDLVQVLEQLTLRSDLRFLTMLSWTDVLPSRGLVRRIRAWCRLCYEEWRETGQVIYEPLLWALEVVSMCPRHRLRLQLCCPYSDCGSSQLPIAPRSPLEYCSRCDRWLGSPLQDEAENRAALGDEECEWQEWVVNAAGELLAAAPSLAVKPYREAIAITVAAYVDGIVGGNASALACQLQVKRDTVQEWRQGQQIPQLGSLIQICSYFGTSPLCLLTGKAVEIAANQKNTLKKNPTSDKPKRRPRLFDTESLQRALEGVLLDMEDCPPSMREVARRLGYDQSHLYKHFPDLCRAISTRYLDYQAMKGMERLQRICDDVRQATLRLHGEGRYPSRWQVEKLLNKPSIFKEREVRAVWQNTLRELGWKQ